MCSFIIKKSCTVSTDSVHVVVINGTSINRLARADNADGINSEFVWVFIVSNQSRNPWRSLWTDIFIGVLHRTLQGRRVRSEAFSVLANVADTAWNGGTACLQTSTLINYQRQDNIWMYFFKFAEPLSLPDAKCCTFSVPQQPAECTATEGNGGGRQTQETLWDALIDRKRTRTVLSNVADNGDALNVVLERKSRREWVDISSSPLFRWMYIRWRRRHRGSRGGDVSGTQTDRVSVTFAVW